MNKLIILNGDSGCGKTHLIRLLMKFYRDDILVIKKYSDRDLRKGEENAIEIQTGCETAEVKSMDYVYTGKNNKVYGFSKKYIDTAFQQEKSPIVIVDDEELLIRLCQEYEGKVCPIYIQRDVNILDFMEELRKGGRSEEQIRERVETRHKSHALWRRRANLFGYRYIINGPFMNDEKLLGWFQLIAKENNIDIDSSVAKIDVKGLVNYFRTLWKGRPKVLNSDKGSEPILDECTGLER